METPDASYRLSERPSGPAFEPFPTKRRLPFQWSDIREAPLHDLPIRDEIIYQWLPLAKHMEVLEIGSGNGFTAYRMRREVRHLTSVDIAPRTVGYLRRRFQDVPNVEFMCADASSPAFSETVSGKFDSVFGLDFFQFVPDPASCLQNLAAVLREGGRLLLQWPNYSLERTRAVTYLRTRAELDGMLRAAKFESWEIYALKLRFGANVLFSMFHEWPLRFYRSCRASSAEVRPQNFDQTWAFRNGRSLDSFKILLHTYWALLAAGMQVTGPCFERTALNNGSIDGNLLVLASR